MQKIGNTTYEVSFYFSTTSRETMSDKSTALSAAIWTHPDFFDFSTLTYLTNQAHPTNEVLSRLRDADVQVYRTDLQGDIIMKSDGDNISVTTAKK